jgi:sigma-B regulation protein RsbU (phosphoserine phosphatase)
MEQDEARVQLLQTIAARAAIELERLRTTTQIATLNQRLMQAAERARTLLAINNAVVLNLTHDALFRAITNALRPVMPFDRSTIFLYDDSRNVLRLAVAEGAIPSERFVPGLELPLEGSHAGWAFRNQRVFFRPDLAKEREYEGEEVLLREGFRSFVVVPLVVRGKSIGTLNLGSLKPMQYGAAEAELLGEVANQLALAIENMREYEEIGRLTRLQQEVKIAADIQQALLPGRDYSGVGFEAAAASVPCRTIGGDFFDYFEVPSGSFGLALGDVAGKGPPAAILTAVLQGILAGHVHLDMGPAETMAHVNRVLVRRAIESRFATLLYATLTPDGRLTYCNAGHIPPFLVRGGSVRHLGCGGLIVGAFHDARYEEETIQLDPADLLVVVSDGVTEARNGEGDEFGNERLSSLVQASAALTPAALVESVLESVRQFSAGAEQHDDVTVLALRYMGR